MQTLKISQIFSNFAFYQTQYLQILSNSDQYYTEVEGAYIHVWPFEKQKLYLGDLLQLWLGHKFVVETKSDSLFDVLNDPSEIAGVYHLYKIEGHLFSNQTIALGWSECTKQSQEVHIEQLFKLYCLFKSISRPAATSHTLQSYKSAI
ncbi:hypothetical protein [Acinetobacter shaoyimingii]|uniref:Uncharacterized protein n=1 Tax=Acinetobacter shaoyimingii TaxID=2715164 RepID=A0A6G8RUG9_9GAMM|nr:hypothetical protein [Acinetobacter shaoyimingii]QIO05582.1 hypothetical protein G8E00_06255 [Acinetobacter shaoyimingii]